MMSLDAEQRYQTPAQLLEAVRAVKNEIEGKQVKIARTLFLVERDERLRDAIRDKFKELGFKVFVASDAGRAVDRFQQQPFDSLIVDGGTTGEEGVAGFDKVMRDAWRQNKSCAGVLILSENQKELANKVDVSQGTCAS